MRKALIGVGLFAAAGLGFGGYWFYKKRAQVDKTVTQPYVAKDLTTEEVRSRLKSGDFKERLEAGKQIDKLEPEEKLRVLLKLAEDVDAPARLLAAKKLLKIEDARAKKKLEQMAKEDSDPDIREMAGGKS